jgi:hypothetical protein
MLLMLLCFTIALQVASGLQSNAAIHSSAYLKLVALLPCQSTSSIRARWTILTTANHYRALMFR